MHALRIAGIVLISSLVAGCGYNTLQQQDEQVTSAWSEVLNQYQRRADLVPNLVNVVKGAVLGTAVSELILLYMFRSQNYSRTVLIIYAIIVVLMITGSRASFRVISEALQRRRQTGRRILIYGAGDGGAMTVRELLNDPDAGVRIVGFIDDDPRKRRMRVRGYPVLGPYDTLSHLVASGSVDAVVVSFRAIDGARLRELAALCAAHTTQLSRLLVGLEPLVDSDRGIVSGAAGGRGRKLHIAAVKSAGPIDGSR